MKSQNRSLLLIFAAALVVAIALPTYAADTGLKSPASYATGTTGNPPTNPDQALVDDVATGSTDDDACALFRTNNPGGGGGVADSELYSDFSFGVPAGATVDGIEVIVSGYRTGTPSAGAYFRVRLDGGSGWTTYMDTSPLTTTDAEYTLGDPSNLWGASWTPDSFSNANFKLEIIPAGPYLSGESWKLDSVRIKVYYTVAAEGLSHGYWKNHPEDWVGYDPSDTLGSIFTLPASLSGLGSFTLAEALDFGGGPALVDKAKILFVQAVAALLNAAHPNIDYPLTVAEVIADVNAALATEDPVVIEALKDLLDGYNNLGGDIGS